MCDITICNENLAKFMLWAQNQDSNKFWKTRKQPPKSLKCKAFTENYQNRFKRVRRLISQTNNKNKMLDFHGLGNGLTTQIEKKQLILPKSTYLTPRLVK